MCFATIPYTTCAYGNLAQIRNDITSNLEVGQSVQKGFMSYLLLLICPTLVGILSGARRDEDDVGESLIASESDLE